MNSVTDFFLGLGAWNWFIVAAVMLLLETIVPGVHFMWFGVAAVVMGAITLALPFPLAGQLVLFALIALALIFVSRRYWNTTSVPSDAPDLNDRGQQYVGRVVTVVEAIERGRGKVKVGDTVWTAEGPDMAAGERAKVTGVNGTVLVISPG